MTNGACFAFKALVAVVLAGLFGVQVGCPGSRSGIGPEVGIGSDAASPDSATDDAVGEVDVPGIQRCSPRALPDWPGTWWERESTHDVEFADGHVYLTMGHIGLAIFEIGADESYLPTSTIPTDGFTREVEVADGIAVVTDHREGLLTYDVTDPATPQKLGQLNFCSDYWPGLTSGTSLLAVSGNLAFVDSNSGVFIVDISDPKMPIEMSYVELPHACTALSASDDVVYAASFDRGFIAIDVSTPSAPEIVGRSEDHWPETFKDDTGWGMKVSGNIGLYIANNHAQHTGTGPLAVADLSNPQGPFDYVMIENSDMYTDSTLYAVEFIGDHAIGSFDGVELNGESQSGGLCRFDLQDPTVPKTLGCIAVGGSYTTAIASGGPERFHLLEAERMSHMNLNGPPAVLATLPLTGYAEHITLSEQGLHVTTSNGYLLQFSEPAKGIAEPSSSVNLDCHPIDMVERNGRLFHACGVAGVVIYDATAADGPAVLYTLELEGGAAQLSVTDDLLFVVTKDEFLFFELLDGAAPNLVAAYPAYYFAASTRIVASGNLMATDRWPGAGAHGWTILDVSDPLSPQVLNDDPILGAWDIVLSPPYIISQLGSKDGPTLVSVHEFWPSSGVELVDQFPLDMDVSDMALSGGTLALLVVNPEDTHDQRIRLMELAAPHDEGDWSDIQLPHGAATWTIEEFDGTIAVSSEYFGVGFLELSPFL
jgi:hypothetical protein